MLRKSNQTILFEPKFISHQNKMTFNFTRKTSTYRRDFTHFKQAHLIRRSTRPEDTLTVYHKNFNDSYMRYPCEFRHQLALIEHQLERLQCTSDMWPLVRQKIVTRRALSRRMQEKYGNCPHFEESSSDP